ncbi:sensor histidine kinase [Thiohalobacter sp.]|uniref:sensor histidine kinase n=1 Tax=Thiohalobacter sp. TaxID=2025948 RepID=UPI0026265D0F|nr:HAMP domain-containing sensor histidine kinase [Thiohalobacter sp.]
MSEPDARDQFDAVLALTIHDIKNSLVLLLDRLDGGALCAEEQDSASTFKYEIRRINNNLVRLLGVYKLGADRYAPQMDEYEVGELLEELVAEYQALLANKGLAIELDCDADLWGRFDRGLLFSVIENAINNAARYSHSRVRIEAAREKGYLRIRVLDDGEGYPEWMLEQCERIKDAAGIDSGSGTTGLGLYFSWVVARLHERDGRHGHIRLANDTELGGSCFEIALPDGD